MSPVRMRVAAVFILLGLLVELISLFWRHPTSFVFFFVIGGALMAMGVLVYLYSLIWKGHHLAAGGS